MAGRAAGMVLAAAVVMLACGQAQGQFNDLAIGPKAGTLGIGGELTTNLVPQVNLRAGVQWFGLDVDAEFDGIDYNIDIDMLNPLLLVDWHPFSGSFHVSGGVLFSDHDIELEATSDETFEIGGEPYSADEVGSLTGDLEFKSVAPYVGIGWGNPLSRDKRWGLSMDLGVAFIGSPDIELSATGSLAAQDAFMADLAEEEENIEDDAEAFKFYPVLSLSLYFRF